MTNTPDYLAKANEYIDAFNDHDLEKIETMLAPNVSYVSANVGTFTDIDNIMIMLREFVRNFPDVYWHAEHIEIVTLQTVSFSYIMTIDAERDREKGVREASERIDFDKNGQISNIEVRQYSR